MSALPAKADKARTCRDVRFVPKADLRAAAKTPLFDYRDFADETLWNVRRSLQLDPRELDHRGPFLGFGERDASQQHKRGREASNVVSRRAKGCRL
jgi:hypothetical protein